MRSVEDDPLDGADVGETKTIRESVELHTIDFEPDVYRGSDRFVDSEIESVDVIEDEYGEKKLVVNFEGEVTKALPRTWDYSREPLTEQEQKAEQRKKWLRKLLITGVPTVGTLAIGTVVTYHVMDALSASGMTINGEAVQTPGIWSFVLVLGLAVFIIWAIQWLPRGGRAT